MRWFILVLMLLMHPYGTFAQTTPLTVRVQDMATMQPVAGVVVTFTPIGGQPITATSDAQGVAVVSLPADRVVVTLAAADGRVIPWEAPYAAGYPIQSVVGLTTFTVQIDGATGVAHHALEQDWAGGPTQADDPTAALAPPATGTVLAAQTATVEIAQLPTSEALLPTSMPTTLPVAPPTSVPSAVPTSSQPVLAILPSSPPTPPATRPWTTWLPLVAMLGSCCWACGRGADAWGCCDDVAEPVPAYPDRVFFDTSSHYGPNADRHSVRCRWAFDTPRTLGRDIGVIRGLATALDAQGYAHTSYLRASEFMANASHSALIVQGVTRAGDRYERRLWQGAPSAGPTAITARQGRIIVAATLDGTVRLWESRDSGATWLEVASPVRASVAQLAILPDGRAVLALLTRSDSQFMLTIAIEGNAGSGSWQVANPVPPSPSAVMAMWQRDTVRTDQAGLPPLVIAQGMAGGLQLAITQDGATWQSQTIASATAHALALSTIGDRLVVVHEEYGARVLWLASSTLDEDWQVTRLATPSSVIVEANPLLHDPQTNSVMLLTTCRFPDRPFGSHRVQLCLSRVALDELHMASVWEHQWAEPWIPIAMAQPHTAQAGAVVVIHGMQAHMAWVGQYIPSDFLHINATQAGFVTTSEVMATTMRIPALARLDGAR